MNAASKSNDRRYFFKASAVGAAAHVRFGLTEEYSIPSLAPSTIPESGGKSSNRSDNYCYLRAGSLSGSILAVRSATTHTEAAAEPVRGGRSTTECIVEGYNFLNKVTVEHMESRLQNEHGIAEPFPRITARGNVLSGVKLDGRLLEVELDEDLFSNCPTMSQLGDYYSSNRDFRSKYCWRFNASEGAVEMPVYHGRYVCSLVRSIQWAGESHPDIEIDGYTLRWRGFGTIYLGEILVEPYHRSLTMVRVELAGSGTRSMARADAGDPAAFDSPAFDPSDPGSGTTTGGGADQGSLGIP